MKKGKRFHVGATVTFKFQKDCINGRYRYNGNDYGGIKTIIIEYSAFNASRDCYALVVEKDGYYMLEDELVEYDLLKENNYEVF